MEINKEIFILLEWPYSQKYMASKYSYFVDDVRLSSSAYFVRKDFYDYWEKVGGDNLEQVEAEFKILENK